MVNDLDDIIIKTGARIMIPFMQLFGLYVYVHGHPSPGGGFQGGCIVAASFILLAVAYDLREAKARLKEKLNAFFCALGVFIYTGTGFMCLVAAGNFLDYGTLSRLFPTDPVMARYYGIAAIELGVQITVMAVMVSIFLDLVTQGKHEQVMDKEP
jgi:multicomponent Na+:H+ antiporter subunit B